MTDKPKALCEMTPEEAAPIMEAWRTGKPLEVFSYLSGWGVQIGRICRLSPYRLPPTPTAPIVDPLVWQVLPDWVQWITRDGRCDVMVGHKARPESIGVFWHSSDRGTYADCLSHLIQWPDDWRLCIVERPE